jgi:6-phosphofructokinase 1
MGAYAIELLNDGIYGVCVGVRDSRMIHLPFANVLDQARPKNELYKIVKKIS